MTRPGTVVNGSSRSAGRALAAPLVALDMLLNSTHNRRALWARPYQDISLRTAKTCFAIRQGRTLRCQATLSTTHFSGSSCTKIASPIFVRRVG